MKKKITKKSHPYSVKNSVLILSFRFEMKYLKICSLFSNGFALSAAVFNERICAYLYVKADIWADSQNSAHLERKEAADNFNIIDTPWNNTKAWSLLEIKIS